MIDIRKYYEKIRNKNATKYGIPKDEQYVIDTTIDCLCYFNPKISPSYFDATRETKELFNNDRELFGRFFSALVYEFKCLSLIKIEEIPVKEEFERFPKFIDIIGFFYNKYILTKL